MSTDAEAPLQSVHDDLRDVLSAALRDGHSPDAVAEVVVDECSALNAATRLNAILDELHDRDDITAIQQFQEVGEGFVAAEVRLVVDIDDHESLFDVENGTFVVADKSAEPEHTGQTDGQSHADADPDDDGVDEDDHVDPEPTADDQEGQALPWGDDPRAALEAHLIEQVKDGQTYVKESRELAEGAPLSGQQVAQHLRRLDSDELEIRYRKDDDWTRGKWRYSLADDGDEGEVPDGEADQDDHRVGDELPEDLDEQDDDDDDADDQSDEVDEDVGARLPEGVTRQQLEAARDETDYLDEIAEELGISEGTARAALVHTGLYRGVREASRR